MSFFISKELQLVKYREVFIATAGQTVFTLNGQYEQNLNRIDVTIDGVFQYSPNNFTESSTTTFTLTEGVAVGTSVVATYFSLYK